MLDGVQHSAFGYPSKQVTVKWHNGNIAALCTKVHNDNWELSYDQRDFSNIATVYNNP